MEEIAHRLFEIKDYEFSILKMRIIYDSNCL